MKRLGQGAVSSKSQQRYVSLSSYAFQRVNKHRPRQQSTYDIGPHPWRLFTSQQLYLYRPFLLGEDQNDNIRIVEGGKWAGERWRYRLSQRWRNLIFRSTSYLDLYLVCTNGTPVADMLAHWPPLPLRSGSSRSLSKEVDNDRKTGSGALASVIS
jgi:hypothetical protein